MRIGMQLLFRLKRALLRRLRWRTRGVKVMLFNAAGELLLVRNSYGRSELYVLPGGGIRPFEAAAAAALREVREEVGLEVERIEWLSTHLSEAEGRCDTVHLFIGFSAGTPKADGLEVEEAQFFALDSLPESVSPATLRRIAEHRGECPAQHHW